MLLQPAKSGAAKPAPLGPVSDVSGGTVLWAADSATFFCVTVESGTMRPSVLWRYSVSARGISQPYMVYNETDPGADPDEDRRQAAQRQSCIHACAQPETDAKPSGRCQR